MDFESFTTEDDTRNVLSKEPKKKSLSELKKRVKGKKRTESYLVKYNNETEFDFKALRKSKQDPITSECFNNMEETAYIFDYMWDPYSGIRTEKDPFGGIYFNPINLIYHWYIHRLDNLWIKESDETNGYWSGVPGDMFGTGENCFIPGRGHFPDKYLFRIPIKNCYIPIENRKSQAVTMGPKLSDEEIQKIYDIAKNHWEEEYILRFRKKMPNLVKMKQMYDLAIQINPLGDSATDEENYAENKKGVDWLLKH